MSTHSLLTGLELHEPYHFVQEADPGSVGSGLYWLKVSTGSLKRRNGANNAWLAIGGATSFVGLTDVPANYTGAGNKVVSVNSGATALEFTTPLSNPTFATLTDAATITWALSANKHTQLAKVTLGGNRTLAFTGLTDGMSGVLQVVQDGTGSRTLTLPAASLVNGDGTGAVTLTTAPGAVDILSFVYNGANTFWTYGNKFS